MQAPLSGATRHMAGGEVGSVVENTVRAQQMEKGAFQMLHTIKQVFILLFLFLMRRGGVVTRAKCELSKPQLVVCVLVCIRQKGLRAARWRGRRWKCHIQDQGRAAVGCRGRLPAPARPGNCRNRLFLSVCSSFLCRRAFQMGLNEMEK